MTLDHAGFASRHIITVSGYKSESSIKYYSRTSEAQKEMMSDTISSALGEVPGNSGNDSHQGRPTPSLPRPSPKAVSSLSPKPGPPVDAELSLSSEPPISDSHPSGESVKRDRKTSRYITRMSQILLSCL